MERVLEWIDEGTTLCRGALRDLEGPSLLPDWSRRHVAAHLFLNADALGNLVEWARTGVERPMYPSAEARNADIEQAALLPAEQLRSSFDDACARLNAAMATLTDEQWQATIRNSRGASIPATTIPWLRTREVMIHAVDLDAGITFADLPADFLDALCNDIRTTRDAVPEVDGPLPEQAAYLCGRPYKNLTDADGRPVEPLPPCL
ncbi:maleylpyruvate isomerase family mycothiol-dependent enzyme [Kribbella sp. NPDC048915]|uniref:maleylpyruvate isomerase family mycothiol-dependent enzyme n=1 Tax=Kribbella sp. NPDC048915 TaxID=3155148 RepID=UPI0033E3C757